MKHHLLCLLLLASTHLLAQPGCGEMFYDSGGPNLPYGSSNQTVTISPDNPGERVTVTFFSFSVESNFDALYVYDGGSTAAPQIMSNNGAGSVPGGIPGGFWGIAIPGPFTSTSPDGSLTFRFVSDGGFELEGWAANVTCSPQPSVNCERPDVLAADNITPTSAVLLWADPNNAINQWEVIVQPYGIAAPSATTNGTLVSANSYLASGLLPSTYYVFYVRGQCETSGTSSWTTGYLFATRPLNDACENAIVIPVNANSNCSETVRGSLIGATGSGTSIGGCTGTPDDDVWFQFTANQPKLRMSLWAGQGIASGTTLTYAIYQGSCANLAPFACGTPTNYALLENLTVGETYYIRVYSPSASAQNLNFSVCLSALPSCETAPSICSGVDYANTSGTGVLGPMGCLFNTPNPAYFSLKIGTTGSIKMHITQSSVASSTPNLEVNYLFWGPYASLDAACTAINNNAPSNSYIDCGSSQTLNIANAQAGDYYIVMVTNFSNQLGNIRFTMDPASTGALDCSGFALNAFLDSNANGVQETTEPNFPLGEFEYEANNDGNNYHVSSASGRHIVYDQTPSNTYAAAFHVNPEFSSVYNCATTYDSISATLNVPQFSFPVTILQNYNDLTISLVPLSPLRAGGIFKLKIVYRNAGNQIISGNVTFNYDPLLSPIDVSPSGTIQTTDGLTYAFTNLAPFESRSLIVTMSVPAIPAVALGQNILTTASINIPEGDISPANNLAHRMDTVVAGYDPNEKSEANGGQVVFADFGADDYLHYTIRFENVGNAEAFDVKIVDELDPKLDENSVVMLNNSHYCSMERLNQTLTWYFNGINLPVSVANSTIGKGYVHFKIKPKPGYSIGDIIPNTAEIFFDTNPAIVTNTFLTEFVSELGVTDLNPKDATVFPNPTTGQLNVALASSGTISKIDFYDMLGQHIIGFSDISATTALINVGMLARGMYLMTIETSDGLRMVKKIVKK